MLEKPSLRQRLLAVAGYGALIAVAVLGCLWILVLGEPLRAPPRPPAAAGAPVAAMPHPAEALLHVLLALATIILAARALGAACRWFGQPRVIGEVIAGICLGPSLLGRVSPQAAEFLLPPSVSPYLGILAQIGVLLFMFVVGLQLDTARLRHRTHALVAISHASIIVPFLSGAALALWLYPKLSTSDVPFAGFALFLGVTMAVTAFPVLARILIDSGMQTTPLGVMALACAAVDDVTAWCLLAGVVAVIQAADTSVLWTIALAAGYIALMLGVVRPVLRRIVRAHGERELGQGQVGLVVAAVLLSAAATEAIGIHALFGAFLLGAIVPADSPLARQAIAKIEDLVVAVLLPAFFAYTGMRTSIGLVDGLDSWLVCGAIIVVASLGKLGGTAVAARIGGMRWRESLALGALMNTRGLMQLIVLNVGLELGVISPVLFAMLVLMALVSTLATTPLLVLLGQVAPGAAGARRTATIAPAGEPGSRPMAGS